MPGNVRGDISADAFDVLPHVLTWASSSTTEIGPLQAHYGEALCFRLGVILATLRSREPSLTVKIEAHLDRLSGADLLKLLLLPETSRRLITTLHDLTEVGNYLLSALEHPDCKSARSQRVGVLLGCVPVSIMPEHRELLMCVHARIAILAEEMMLRCPAVGNFLQSVMRQLILRIDLQRQGFFSNSPQGYIGRAIITNGHLPIVDEVMLAEAVVHEATHGFVGMSEAIGLSGLDDSSCWLLDLGPYDGVSRVVSPWSGKPLDIPTYLHACFVWWGLLNLWARLLDSSVFEHARVQSRLMRAARGFRGGALVTELAPFRSIIASPLLRVLEHLAEVVQVLLEDCGLEKLERSHGCHASKGSK